MTAAARPASPSPSQDLAPYAPPAARLVEIEPPAQAPRILSARGRIGRLRYLVWNIALTTASACALMAALAWLVHGSSLAWLGLLTAACASGLLAILFGIQRLHDIGWSGWLMLVTLLPVIGPLFPLLLLLIPGTQGANRYGPPPTRNGAVLVVAAIAVALLAGGAGAIGLLMALPFWVVGMATGQ